VCTNDVESIIVTGADDGALRAWHARREESQSSDNSGLIWEVDKAHKTQILAVAVYTPTVANDNFTTAHWPKYLYRPLVVSVSRNGMVRLCNLATGAEVCPPFLAHNKAVTSVCVFPGHPGNILSKAIDPFIVTGSEDHSARLWSMVDCVCLRTLNRHIFDVTSVFVYVPPLPPRDSTETRKSRNGPLRKSYNTGASPSAGHGSGGAPDASLTVAAIDPIIITGGMDDTVRLWQYSTGEIIDVLTDAKCHITCLTYFNMPASENAKYSGPLVAAGDGNGVLWLWALRAPYELLVSLPGHADEVRSVHAFAADGK
jgi:WD40 repeat protein